MRHRIHSPLCIALLAVALTAGCEDVVNVEIKDAEPQLVIEGIIEDGYARFFLSRTIGFYVDDNVQPVEGATVVVSNGSGITDTLRDYGPGTYVSSSYYFDIIGTTYTASVFVDGETYIASTTLPPRIRIDSLGTEFTEGFGVEDEVIDGYQIHIYFQDVADRADYASIKLFRNGNEYSDYYLYDGRYTDGNPVDYEYLYYVFQPGQRITIELISMDRVMYDYFQTLSEVWIGEDGGSILDGTPSNPNTNWSGGALGYFGAFNSHSSSIVIEAE